MQNVKEFLSNVLWGWVLVALVMLVIIITATCRFGLIGFLVSSFVAALATYVVKVMISKFS